MSKLNKLHELTNILAKALRHRIGAIVNQNEIYAQKYSRDADILLREAQKIALEENWNSYDKIKIRNELKRKLKQELEKKDFLDEKKFDIMDDEIDKALATLNLK